MNKWEIKWARKSKVLELFRNKVIHHQRTVAYNPQSNAEVRSIKEAQSNKGSGTPSNISFLRKFDTLKFPLNSSSDVPLLEEILNNRDEFENAVTEMYKIGGNTMYSFVKRILTTLFTNDVALEYSWMGRKGKKPFHCMKIAELVICAAERAKINGSRRDTEVAIQIWLNGAANRKNVIQKKF
ncbi:uncharacterized protein LOC143356334 [Halictus rubicundus]|uniref:uncharacterized protein LOC143356334 n=1 Tax=Halictus rubicundus TaxID=77578 RepID=UPI004035F10D